MCDTSPPAVDPIIEDTGRRLTAALSGDDETLRSEVEQIALQFTRPDWLVALPTELEVVCCPHRLDSLVDVELGVTFNGHWSARYHRTSNGDAYSGPITSAAEAEETTTMFADQVSAYENEATS